MNIIYYNSLQIPSPTPLVTMERVHEYNNSKIGFSDNMVLKGQLTGNFNAITGAQQDLINIFSKNFGSFKIIEEEASGLIGGFISSNNVGFINNGAAVNVRWTGLNPQTKYVLFYRDQSSNLIDSRSVGVFAESGNSLSCCSLAKKSVTINPTTFYSSYFSPGVYLSDTSGSLSGFIASPTFSPNITYYNQANLDTQISSQTFYLKEISNIIYEKSGIIINDISFDESIYDGVLNYTVNLAARKFDYNVTDPQNEFQYSELEDKRLELVHSISAKGINTNPSNLKSNALENAISFVQQFSGLSAAPSVYFINRKNSNFYIQSVKESIDRLNSIYSLEENYVNDLSTSSNNSGVLRYTIDLSSGIKDGTINLQLNGEIQGPLNGSIENLRDQINPLALITDYTSVYSLNTTPISYSINEFKSLNRIAFNYDFDNLPFPNPYVEHNISISNSEISQNTEIQIDGKIIARGAFSQRESLLLNKLATVTGETYLKNIAINCLSGYNNILNRNNFNYPLRVTNIKVKKDINNSIVEFSATLDDKFMPNINDLSDANYNISIDYPQWIIKPNPTCNLKGFYILSDFDITSLYRKKIDLNLTLKNEITTTASDQYLNTISQNFIDSVNQSMQRRDNISYTKKKSNGRVYDNLNFNIEFSLESGGNSFFPKIQ